MSQHTHHVKRARTAKALFTPEQRREMRRLAEQGYAAPVVARMLGLPRDAVTIWLGERGLTGQRRGDKLAAPVTLPKLKCLEGRTHDPRNPVPELEGQGAEAAEERAGKKARASKRVRVVKPSKGGGR